MPLVLAKDDIRPSQIKPVGVPGSPEGSGHTHNFFRATADTPVAPSAYLNIHTPGRSLSPHFHVADQFQIIMDGKGTFGRHDVSAYCVHFSRAYTPYGPLVADKQIGWAFMTLRTRFDPGQQRLPAAMEKLKGTPGRHPWQVTEKAIFPPAGAGVGLNELSKIKDDSGLFAYALTLDPNNHTTAPAPAGGDGQYVIVVKGSVIHDNREHNAPAVMFARPDEPALRLQAGAEGVQALVLNFPQVRPRILDAGLPSAAAGLKKWQCVLCAFAYDEALGMPAEGIPAGTRWEDVPETWSCPDCSAGKGDFQMVEA